MTNKPTPARLRRLTRAQKMALTQRGLDPKPWLLLKELPNCWILRHKLTGEIKVAER